MSLRRAFPAIVGLTATLATTATLALDVMFAYEFWPSSSSIKILAVVAFVAETIVLVFALTKLFKYYRGTNGCRWRNRCSTWFASDVLATVLASVVSTALLILVARTGDLPEAIMTIPMVNAIIGSSVTLGFAFVSQLFFVVVYFVLHRRPGSEQGLSSEASQIPSQFPTRVKTVPYNRTKPALSQATLRQWTPSEYSSRPGTSGGRSAAETVNSFSASMSSFALPLGSKTRLLSQSSKSGWRQGSLDSNGYRERPSTAEDGLDSWETSSVDSHNRHTALDTSSPTRSRFLDPIPASPVHSRSPSPGCPSALEPPRRGPRDRCFSPVSRAQQDRAPMSQEFQLNIHPLFRSDSPGPPPLATPGTVVIAAPNAGQYIAGMSVNQVRSGNFQNPQSPLSRKGSYESFRKTHIPNSDRR